VINSDQLRQDILEDGTEDYTGLYEIIWSLNHKYPAVSREQKVDVARRVFSELLRESRVAVFENVWASSNFAAVDSKAALNAVANDSAWEDPGPGPALWFLTTE
jgi:hypothetical protein